MSFSQLAQVHPSIFRVMTSPVGLAGVACGDGAASAKACPPIMTAITMTLT